MVQNTLAVLIPVYNAEKYLEETLDSLLCQTYKNFTLFLCDDGSTDSTLSILNKFGPKFQDFKLLTNVANIGIVKTRNRLLLEAREFEFLAWIDSDDIATPERFELQLDFLRQNPSVGVVGGWINLFGNKSAQNVVRMYSAFDTDLRSKIFRYAPIANPCAMFRQTVVSKVGLMNEAFVVAEDLEFWFRVGEHFCFANVQKVLLNYRQHENSATFSRLAKIEINTFLIRYRFFFSKKYHFGLGDFFFCLVQLITAVVMPASFRIKLFNFLRSRKFI